jgi:hypothetical protein
MDLELNSEGGSGGSAGARPGAARRRSRWRGDRSASRAAWPAARVTPSGPDVLMAPRNDEDPPGGRAVLVEGSYCAMWEEPSALSAHLNCRRQRRPTGFCHQTWLGSKGNRRAIPFARPCDVACVDNGPPACFTAAGGADPFVSVALATARTQLAAIRASELELVPYGPHVLRDEISSYLLARPQSETAAAPGAAVGSASAPLPCLGGRHR